MEFNFRLIKDPIQLFVPLIILKLLIESSHQFCIGTSYCTFLLSLLVLQVHMRLFCTYGIYITDFHASLMSYSAVSPPTCHFWDTPDVLLLKVMSQQPHPSGKQRTRTKSFVKSYFSTSQAKSLYSLWTVSPGVFLNVDIPCVITRTYLVDLFPIHIPKKKSNQQ